MTAHHSFDCPARYESPHDPTVCAEPATEQAEPQQELFCCAVHSSDDINDQRKAELIHAAAHQYWDLLQKAWALVPDAQKQAES